MLFIRILRPVILIRFGPFRFDVIGHSIFYLEYYLSKRESENINTIDSNQIYQYISKNFESLDDFSTIIVGDKKRLEKLQNFDSFNFQLISADEII